MRNDSATRAKAIVPANRPRAHTNRRRAARGGQSAYLNRYELGWGEHSQDTAATRAEVMRHRGGPVTGRERIDREDLTTARKLETGRPLPTYGEHRTCKTDGCTTRLRRTRAGDHCSVHELDDRADAMIPVMHWDGNGSVPVEHVRPIVERLIAVCGDQTKAAFVSGVTERTFHRIRSGMGSRGRQTRSVTLDVVDKLLIGLGAEHERGQWEAFAC